MSQVFQQNLSNIIFNSQSKKVLNPFFIKPKKIKSHHLKIFTNKNSRYILQEKSKTDAIHSPSHFSSFQTNNPQSSSPLPKNQSFLPVLHQKCYNPLKIKQLYLHHQKQKRLKYLNKSIQLNKRNQLLNDKQKQVKYSKQKYIHYRYQNNDIPHNSSFINLKEKIKNQQQRFRNISPKKDKQKSNNKDKSDNKDKSINSIYLQTLQNVQINLRKDNVTQLKNVYSHFPNKKINKNVLLSEFFRSCSSSTNSKATGLTSVNSLNIDENSMCQKKQKQTQKQKHTKGKLSNLQSLIFQDLRIKNTKQQQMTEQNQGKQKMNSLFKRFLQYDNNQSALIKQKIYKQ